MKKIKKFYLFNESSSEDEKVKKAYKDMLINITESLFGMGGLRIKLSFMLKDENDLQRKTKLQECLNYLKKIEPSFKNGDFTIHFKHFYKNVEPYVKLIYETLKYVMSVINFFNIQGLENINNAYKEYVNLANTSLGWQNRLPSYLK